MSRHKRYPWPASKIDADVMHELHLASKESGLPITRIIGDVVHAAMTARLIQAPTPQPIGFTVSLQQPHSAA